LIIHSSFKFIHSFNLVFNHFSLSSCKIIFICSHLSTSRSPISILSHLCASITIEDKPTPTKASGLSQQYLAIKRKFPEFIVLFQVGDFYEIYSSDALKVSEKTSLRISKNPNVNRIMAGFPVRSLDSWLTTLVQQGFQIAICPQIPEKYVIRRSTTCAILIIGIVRVYGLG